MPRRSNKKDKFHRDAKGRRVANEPVMPMPEHHDLSQAAASSDEVLMDIEAEVGGAIDERDNGGDEDWYEGAADNTSGGSRARSRSCSLASLAIRAWIRWRPNRIWRH